jgi:hypothetical protein
MKILSIDWDYYFPDSFAYDWGHQEKVFFLEAIWQIRTTNHNLITGKEAMDEFVPTIPKDFWKRVLKEGTTPPIFVAESHASISALPFTGASVTNLDAHHDCGYGRNPSLECGNWASHLGSRIKEYHLCYPEWRKIGAEGKSERQPDSIINGLPEPENYDIIFVCRSGCWTPPWYDTKFRSFLKQSGQYITYIDQYAGKNRALNMKTARAVKAQLDAQFQSLNPNRKVA